MRPVKEGKIKGKLNKNLITPSLMHGGDFMDRCIKVANVYLNPSEQTWGWSVRWTCRRMNEEDCHKRSAKWLDDEAAKMKEDEAEEKEEEEGDDLLEDDNR